MTCLFYLKPNAMKMTQNISHQIRKSVTHFMISQRFCHSPHFSFVLFSADDRNFGLKLWLQQAFAVLRQRFTVSIRSPLLLSLQILVPVFCVLVSCLVPTAPFEPQENIRTFSLTEYDQPVVYYFGKFIKSNHSSLNILCNE